MVNASETQINKFLLRLKERCESEEDYKFISQLIQESKSESGFYITPHNLDGILYKRNPKLVDLFHSVSKEMNIQWSHTSIEDEDTNLF